MAKLKTYMLTGKGYWMKVIGPARENNFGESKWEFDVVITPETKKELLKLGWPKTKIKSDPRGDFVQFDRPGIKRDGEASKPFSVLDQYGEPWDGKTLIGNGSDIQVKYTLNERDYKGKKFLKPGALEICVTELVPYTGGSKGFQFKAKPAVAAKAQDEDWNDEVPF